MGWVLPPLVGNRTVTQALFPPSRRGKCCAFLQFCFFRVWLGVFCRFFSVLLVSGSLFEKIFGSELLFLGFGVGRVYFGAVFLYFCFIIWFVVPESVSRKFSSGQVRCLNKFSGANFCFMVSVLVCWQFFPFSKGEMLSVFSFCVFLCLVRCLLSFFYRSSFLRVVVWKTFSGANFCFCVSVWVLRVLVLFCLCFCFIICFFAPETVSKKFS